MNITTQEMKRCELVAVSGRIDSATAPELEKVLMDLVEQGKFRPLPLNYKQRGWQLVDVPRVRQVVQFDHAFQVRARHRQPHRLRADRDQQAVISEAALAIHLHLVFGEKFDQPFLPRLFQDGEITSVNDM